MAGKTLDLSKGPALESDRLTPEEVTLSDRKAHKGLTPQQETYCQFRVQGLNKKDAFIRSGLLGEKNPAFATKYASDLEARPHVLARIGVIGAARALALRKEPTTPAPPKSEDGTQYTPEWVRQRLYDLSREAEAVGDYAPAIKAAELIGKSIGMFSDKPTKKEKKKPNEGEQSANVPEPESTFNVQVFNSLFNSAPDDAGNGDSARDVTPAREGNRPALIPDGTNGPDRDLSLLDRLTGALAEGVLDEAEG